MKLENVPPEWAATAERLLAHVPIEEYESLIARRGHLLDLDAAPPEWEFSAADWLQVPLPFREYALSMKAEMHALEAEVAEYRAAYEREHDSEESSSVAPTSASPDGRPKRARRRRKRVQRRRK